MLVFHGQVDLAGVAGHLDLGLPLDGLLLFFVDFDVEAGGDMVSGMYDDERGGSRVLYVPAGTPLRRRPPPGPVRVHREALVAPLLTHTFPRAGAVGLDVHVDGEQYQMYEDEVDLGWRALVQEYCPPGYQLSGLHQLGGHARPIQGPVEADALQAACTVRTREGPGSTALAVDQVRSQQAAWALLLQLDSDDQLDCWFGDLGTLYWVAPRADLTSGKLETPRFVAQNC